MTVFWPSSQNEWIFTDAETISPGEFEALRVVSDRPLAMLAPPYKLCRALINGRWHAVDRQYSCGCPMYFARPIRIRLDSTHTTRAANS